MFALQVLVPTCYCGLKNRTKHLILPGLYWTSTWRLVGTEEGPVVFSFVFIVFQPEDGKQEILARLNVDATDTHLLPD